MRHSSFLRVFLLAILVLACAALMYALTCAACGLFVVQADEVAVVVNVLSGELETPLRPGSHFLGPFQTAVVYSTRQQEYTMASGSPQPDDAVEALTRDGQQVWLDITILYSIDPDLVNIVYIHWEANYNDDFIRPTARNAVREVIARYDAEDIYGDARVEIPEVMEGTLREQLAEEGFILRDLLVRNVVFTPEYTATIEAQIIATQQAEIGNP